MGCVRSEHTLNRWANAHRSPKCAQNAQILTVYRAGVRRGGQDVVIERVREIVGSGIVQHHVIARLDRRQESPGRDDITGETQGSGDILLHRLAFPGPTLGVEDRYAQFPEIRHEHGPGRLR